MIPPFPSSSVLSRAKINCLPLISSWKSGFQWKKIETCLICSSLTLLSRSPIIIKRTSKSRIKSSNSNSNRLGGFGESHRRITDTLLTLNVVFFGLQLVTGPLLLSLGAKINALIWKGQYYRLITCAFLHGDFLHLAFNCNALNQIGPMVETFSGRPRFTAVYFISVMSASLLSFFMSPHVSIGASGAIFGMMGALGVFAARHRNLMGQSADSLLMRLRDTAIINLIYGCFFRKIDNWGHFGGLIGGVIAAYLLGPNLVQVETGNRRFRDNQTAVVDKPPIPILAHRKRKDP